MAQDVSLPTPTSESPDPIRGPAEGILELKISDGLKRFLLADLYARYGGYEKALEIVDYTKTVEILDKKLTVEEDPEVIRLLEVPASEDRRHEASPGDANPNSAGNHKTSSRRRIPKCSLFKKTWETRASHSISPVSPEALPTDRKHRRATACPLSIGTFV